MPLLVKILRCTALPHYPTTTVCRTTIYTKTKRSDLNFSYLWSWVIPLLTPNVTPVGNNNFHSTTPTANGLITCLLAFSLTPHVKSTRAHTQLHNASPLYILSYEYIAHSLLAITVLAFVRASYSNTTVIHFSTRILARSITLSISLHFSPSNERDASSHQESF